MNSRVGNPTVGSAPPPPQHNVTCRADGSAELTVQADDTIESLYALAYGTKGIPGGAGQLATWLFSKHGGLPDPGTRLRVPDHERMLRLAAEVPGEVAKAALRCLSDGVSCGELRKKNYQAKRALAGQTGKGLQAGQGGFSIGRDQQSRPSDSKKESAAPRTVEASHSTELAQNTESGDTKKVSRAALGKTLQSFHVRISDTAKREATPSEWQAIAADILRDGELNLSMLAHLEPADIERATAPILIRAGLAPEQARAASTSLCAALTRAAGHQFFQDVQTSVRTTLNHVHARLERSNAAELGAALRDGLRALGPEIADDLREQLDLDGPLTAKQQQALAGALRSRLEERIKELTRTPDPAALLTDYPGIVALHAAASGVGVSLRQPNLPEQALDRLEATVALIVPAMRAKRAIDTWLNGEIRISGDNLLAEGLRQRCDFDRMLDLTYQWVSRAAVGGLTTAPGWQKQLFRDWLKDETEGQVQHRLVDLIGWVAE